MKGPAVGGVVGVLAFGLILVCGHAAAARGPVAYILTEPVTLLDTTTNTVIGTVTTGSAPNGVTISPDDKWVFVANAASNNVSIIDRATNTVVATLPVGQNPLGIGIKPDSSRAYVANFATPGSVSVIDVATKTIASTIPVPAGPIDVVVTNDGAFAYVVGGVGNVVSVLDTATEAVVDTIVTGANPAKAVITPDGSRTYLTTYGDDTVTVISTASRSVIATIPVGDLPNELAISPNGSVVYVPNDLDGTVSVISTATNTVTNTISVPVRPSGIAFTPDGALAYVTHFIGGILTVIDTASETMLDSVPLSGGANTLAIAAARPLCGDSVLDAGESCDDGNTLAGDGCSANCQIEPPTNTPTSVPPTNTPTDVPPPNTPTSLPPTNTATALPPTSTPTDVPPQNTPTVTATPVPTGTCGDGTTDSGEECDDGNSLSGDCCSAGCEKEPLPCVPLGICADVPASRVITNPSVKQTVVRDARPRNDSILDRWLSRGEFTLLTEQLIDPDTEIVQFELIQNDGTGGHVVLYSATLDPDQCPGLVCFEPSTSSDGFDRRWRFSLKRAETDVPGAPGWRSGLLKRSAPQPNRIKFALKGADTVLGTPQLIEGIRRIRQNMRIGDDCVTVTLDCQPNQKRTRYRCREAHCGNGARDRGEQCGEPGLSVCTANRVCDTCRCLPTPE